MMLIDSPKIPGIYGSLHGRDDLRLRLHRGAQGAAGSARSSAAGDGESLEGHHGFFGQALENGGLMGRHPGVDGETNPFMGFADLPNNLK